MYYEIGPQFDIKF